MAGCKTKHDNSYCSTSERKIHVDVEHEIARIDRIKRELGQGRGWRQIEDSRDRISAVRMGCARGSRKRAEQYT